MSDEEKGKSKMVKINPDSKNEMLLNLLPEGCVATTISLTGPQDACRFACVSKLFKSAATSDAVWDLFLPSDYRDFLARSDGGDDNHINGLLLDSMSKKDLFFYLVHHPLLLDNSTLSFFVDKSTGKKCFTMSAKELAITWGAGDTPRYWAFHSLPESRFPEVAQLYAVCWLEIRGKMKTSMLSPNTTYAAYLVFKMIEGAYGFYTPAKATLTTPGGKSETRKVYFKNEENNQRDRIAPRRFSRINRLQTPSFQPPPPAHLLPRERGDGWLEVEIGELFTLLDEDGEVEMSVMELAGNWKSGLIIEGIEFRPKVVSE